MMFKSNSSFSVVITAVHDPKGLDTQVSSRRENAPTVSDYCDVR